MSYRESRELRFTESSEADSMRDSLNSLVSTENMAAGRNSPRKDSYDHRLDADGGGAQFR